MSRCIVVSGPPCAGKSTLATALAARFRWPLFCKDLYKERVFRHLGGRDREWSRRVSLLAWDLLLCEAASTLAHGHDCVLEGNFRAPQAAVVTALAAVPGAHFAEVHCVAAPAVLIERYRRRALDGTRHPGHVDLEAAAELERELEAPDAPVLPRASVLVWDTTAGFESAAVLDQLESVFAAGGVR